MVLSRRERYIVIATLAFVAAAVLYWVVLSPLKDRLDAVDKEKGKLAGQLRDANDLVAKSRRLSRDWKQQVKEGKKIDMKSDWASADSQLLTNMDLWAKTADAGVRVNQSTPVQSSDKGRMQKVAREVTGTGTWRSIINLLWKIENAPIPVRLSELQISTRRDGIDDLTAVLKVSTLYSPRSGAPGNAAPVPAASQPESSANQPNVGSTPAPEPRAAPASAPAGETGAAGSAEAAESAGAASQPTTQGDS